MNKINLSSQFICSVSEPDANLLQQNRSQINDVLIAFGAESLINMRPVFLRWINTEKLGFPRQHFRIYRKVRTSVRPRALFPNQHFDYRFTSTTVAKILWSHLSPSLMYEIRFNVLVKGYGMLHIQALDKNSQAIPGQLITIDTRGIGSIIVPCCMKAPNIAGIQLMGTPLSSPGGEESRSLQIRISELRGLDAELYINKNTWEEAQIVGLPYFDGETSLPAYDTQSQGYVPNLLDGAKATRLRLELLKLLTPNIPAHPIGIPALDWGPQDLDTYLDCIRDQNLSLVTECLKSTDDFDSNNLQVNFIKEMTLEGIRQEFSTATSSEDATTRIHVVGSTLVGVYADSYFATTMGYGTLAFIAEQQEEQENCLTPEGTVMGADFLVANKFVFVNELTRAGTEVEVVALPQAMPPPVTPSNLQARQLYHNRPEGIDGEGTESVKLSWNWPPAEMTYSYFISWIKGDASPSFRLLNNERLKGVKGFEPYLAARPFRADPQNADLPPLDISKVFYTNSNLSIPLNGQRLDKYQVISSDWFGRFSNWANVNYIAKAFPPQQPLVNDVRLFINPSEEGPSFAATLEIDFGWNWIDRSPNRIEFSGIFLPTPITTPPANAPQSFAFSNSGLPVAQPLTIRFSGDTPFIAPEFIGEKPPSGIAPSCYVINTPTPPRENTAPEPGTTSSDIRRYTLIVKVMNCDFSVVSELAYAVYARAYEAVQPTNVARLIEKDALGNNREKAFLVRILDATPPPPPEGLNTDINWTALPDATGIARGVINWGNIPQAKGYNVWEATEAAIQEYISDSEIPVLPENSSLQVRANYLRALLEGRTLNADFELIDPIRPKPNNVLQSLQAFSKLNRELVRRTKLEVSLPAAADSLYVYRISAINELNNESDKSSTVFYAVPRQNRPGQPNLILRPMKSPNPGVWVLAIPGGGVYPVGYRIYRVRKFGLATELGTMGLPKVREDAPDWLSFEAILANDSLRKLHYLIRRLVKEEEKISGNNDPSVNKVLQYGKAYFDAQGASWFPYFYQIVAIGQENRALGELAGCSRSSGAQKVEIVPTEPPRLTDLSITGGGIFQVIDRIRFKGAGLWAFSTSTNHLYIENTNTDQVEIWNALNNRLVRKIALSNLNIIRSNPEKQLVYFVFNRTRLVVYNEKTRRLSTPVLLIFTLIPPIFPGIPTSRKEEMVTGLVVDNSRNRVYVAYLLAKKVSVLNTQNKIISTIEVNTNHSLLAIAEKANLLYVLGLRNQLVEIFNLKTQQLLNTISLPYQPRTIWMNNLVGKLYIEDATNNHLYVYPLAKKMVAQAVINLGSALRDLNIEASTGIVWLLTSTGELQGFNGFTNEMIQTQNVDAAASKILMIPHLNRMYISKPVLSEISVVGKAETNVVLTFATNLPVKNTVIGTTSIELATLTREETTGQFIREPAFFTIYLSQVQVGALLQPIVGASFIQLSIMPEVTRSEKNAAGMVTYSVRVATAALQGKTIIVKATNPNHQITEQQFQRILE